MNNNLSYLFQNGWKGKQSLFTNCYVKQGRTSAVVCLEEGSSPSLANDHRIWTRKGGREKPYGLLAPAFPFLSPNCKMENSYTRFVPFINKECAGTDYLFKLHSNCFALWMTRNACVKQTYWWTSCWDRVDKCKHISSSLVTLVPKLKARDKQAIYQNLQKLCLLNYIIVYSHIIICSSRKESKLTETGIASFLNNASNLACKENTVSLRVKLHYHVRKPSELTLL